MQVAPIEKIVVLGFSSADFYKLGDPAGFIEWVPTQRLCHFQIDPSADVSAWVIVMLPFTGSNLRRTEMLARQVRKVYVVRDHYSCDCKIREILDTRLVMLKGEEAQVSVPVCSSAHCACDSCVVVEEPVVPSRSPMTFIITDEPSERRMFDHAYSIRVLDSKNAQDDAFCGDLKAGDDLIIGSVKDVALQSSLENLGAERGFRVACVPSSSRLLQIVRERIAPPGRL